MNRFPPALCCEIIRFPRIIISNFDISIYNNDIKLKSWIENQFFFGKSNYKYLKYAPFCDGESANLCIHLGKKRINQPDITSDLNLGEEYLYNGIPINTHILDKYELTKKKFITIHRGIDNDQIKESTKLWPQSHYNDLITKLKLSFPDIKIVQLGVSHERCESMQNIDINLIEKTTLPDIAALLKNAWLHIDCEGGLVHLRHALKGGKSVVIFGPTSPSFFGYSENINIRSDLCKYPCEWLTENWQKKCIRKSNKHICMKSINADIVMNKILEIFQPIG
ncbi:glycosyltransferase family 9 protein [Oxalobacter aliiformigenes]|uniref:glycosyltransferase family 9 protein n=1 Tax=Oxalobacter aliiformigenes TaxID=2946593 RepID=UPI002FCD7013